MLRLLASVLLGIAMFASPSTPSLSTTLRRWCRRSCGRAPPPPTWGRPGARSSGAYGANDGNPQADPAAPGDVPRSQWDNSRGGCALWDWDVC